MTPEEIAAQAAQRAAAQAAVIAPPEPVEPTEPVEEPTVYPWDKEVAKAFEDPAVATQVSAFMRDTYQPYVTQVETARKEAEDKSWVFDGLNDPEQQAATLAEVAQQVYGPEAGARITQLIEAGWTVDQAVAQQAAEEEPVAAALPPEVAETVEWAKQRKAADEAAEAKAAEEAALAEANVALEAWQAATLEANPDIVGHEKRLFKHVVTCDGDLEAALASYREDHPAPAVERTAAVTAVPGGNGTGAGTQERQFSTLGEAAGSVFDAAAGPNIAD